MPISTPTPDSLNYKPWGFGPFLISDTMLVFEEMMRRAEGLKQTGDRPHYHEGFMRGLRRAHHGDMFGTDEEHEKWLALADEYIDDSRKEMGLGYRDGLVVIARANEFLQLRKRLRWSQDETAEELETSKSWVSKVEKGRIIPKIVYIWGMRYKVGSPE